MHTNILKLPSIYNDFLHVSEATCLAEHVGVHCIKKGTAVPLQARGAQRVPGS